MSSKEIKDIVAQLMANPTSDQQNAKAKKIVFGDHGFTYGVNSQGNGLVDQVYMDGTRISGHFIGNVFVPVRGK